MKSMRLRVGDVVELSSVVRGVRARDARIRLVQVEFGGDFCPVVEIEAEDYGPTFWIGFRDIGENNVCRVLFRAPDNVKIEKVDP